MAYKATLIHGATEYEISDDDRYIQVSTDMGLVNLHCEDDQSCVETQLGATEVLALIAALTEAVRDLI